MTARFSPLVAFVFICGLGNLSLVIHADERPKFRLPLDFDTPTHFYFDNNPEDGVAQSWTCNSGDTYDKHGGTDFTTGVVGDVIHATASGWIIYAEDGHGDGDCLTTTRDTIPFGNHVRIYHGNGIDTIYGHMTMGSVTTRPRFLFVACGDEIGRVGMSGYVCSSHPDRPPFPFHVHFEPRRNVDPNNYKGGLHYDPYIGSCSPTVESWWVDQSGGSLATQCSAHPWEFDNADCVRASGAVNVHPSAGGICTGPNGMCPSETEGSRGVIVGTPEGALYSGAFYVWWHVRWADGKDGWSNESSLSSDSCSGGTVPVPANLQQLSYTGALIAIGNTTDSQTVTFSGTVRSDQGKAVALEVEVSPSLEPFTGQGSRVYSSNLVDSGEVASKCVTLPGDGAYHWRARTRDQDGQASTWVSFGDNPEFITDFYVQASVCATPCSVQGAATKATQKTAGLSCGVPIVATLSAVPGTGDAPLNGVSLAASVSGSATGPISYTFYCNRADARTDITSGAIAQFPNVTANPETVAGVCGYAAPGTYMAKVIVKRGSLVAEARAQVTVTQPTSQGPSVTTSGASSVTQGSATLNLAVNPNSSSTTVWFDWGASTSFGNSTNQQSAGAGSGSSLLSSSIGSLTCNTIRDRLSRPFEPRALGK